MENFNKLLKQAHRRFAELAYSIRLLTISALGLLILFVLSPALISSATWIGPPLGFALFVALLAAVYNYLQL